MATSICGACGARIVWVNYLSGKHSPMDEEMTTDGNTMLRPDDGKAEVVKASDKEACNRNRALQGLAPATYYRPHWASCPHAGRYRKGRSSVKKGGQDRPELGSQDPTGIDSLPELG